MPNKVTAEFNEVRCVFTLWTGAFPVVKTEDQRNVSDNVLRMDVMYGQYKTTHIGPDHYYFKETDTGWEVVTWVDPDQPWADSDRVGTRIVFSKTSDEIIVTHLTEVPILTGVHDGVMLNQTNWDEVERLRKAERLVA